jgi:S-formylglutathione hydrolase FrmB
MKKAKWLVSATLALASVVAVGQSEPSVAEPVRERRGPEAKATPECTGRHHTFHSAALQREMAYCLLLPADYETSKRAYPVLYLLHGLWGSENDWLALTNVAEQVRPLPLIVVMPQADDSWYVNAATRPEAKYEDYVFGDLVREIEDKYRVEKSRDARFIAGLSMGGYGALKAGLKQPQQFAVVGAFSATANAARRVRLDVKTPAIAFGAADSATRKQNDVFTMIGRSDPQSLPYFFVMTGSDDPIAFQDSRDFLKLAQLMRVQYEYHELPARHEWPLWQKSLEAFLRVIGPRLKK